MSIRQQTPPNLVGQPVVEFRKPDYEATIFNKGYDVLIETAHECPCKSQSASNLLTCQNCSGTGWFHINPIRSKAIISGINKNTEYKDWSEQLIGTVSVTVRDVNKLGFMDKITLVNSTGGTIRNESYFTEVRRLRQIDSEYPFVFLSYQPISIQDIFIFQAVNQPLVRLVSGTDFAIRQENGYTVEFYYDFTQLTNFNNMISIRYRHNLVYYVLDMPHDVRNSSKKDRNGTLVQQILPINVIARKAHYVLNVSDYEGDNIIDNTYL